MRRNGCSATERVQCHVTSAVSNESRAHRTRVREPELRASTAQQGFAGGQQTGEGPKPFGSGPSSCRISAAALSPHSPPLRRRMRLRARGARSAPAEAAPVDPAAPPSAEPERCECSPRPRPRVPRSDRPPLPAFSVRSPSWDPRDREPRAESEVPPERAERPRPPREAPRDPPREPRPRPSRRGDEPPRSSNTSASRPARVRLARGRRPVVPSGISRSGNRWGEVW